MLARTRDSISGERASLDQLCLVETPSPGSDFSGNVPKTNLSSFAERRVASASLTRSSVAPDLAQPPRLSWERGIPANSVQTIPGFSMKGERINIPLRR